MFFLKISHLRFAGGKSARDCVWRMVPRLMDHELVLRFTRHGNQQKAAFKDHLEPLLIGEHAHAYFTFS